MLAEQDARPKPLVSVMENLRPQEAPPQRPVRAVEPPGAQANLWPALSESGCGDNIQDSFLGSFGDAVLQE
jgi:hypothetical protein